MVELDGAVMRAVREHMPGVTRGVLDCHTAANYNIITGHQIESIDLQMTFHTQVTQ